MLRLYSRPPQVYTYLALEGTRVWHIVYGSGHFVRRVCEPIHQKGQLIMTNFQHFRARWLALVTLILVTGCGIHPSESRQGPPTAASETASETTKVSGDSTSALALVGADFVNALRQVPGLAPVHTTVNMLAERRNDAFSLEIRQALDDAGFAVRWTGANATEHLLSYRREQEASLASAERVRFDVALGSVELRRTYLIPLVGNVRPVTPMYVKGADASAIILDDGVFDDPSSSRALATSPLLTVPVDENPLPSLLPGALTGNQLTWPLIALPEVQNVFELGGSNYRESLARHEILAEQILTFPNDSLRLGKINKRLIAGLVEQFDPTRDVFSLVGCSLGPTQVKGGNAALALGRAGRVREALLFSGVSQDKILDEGCWAGDGAATTLPPRGVVITLNRQT